MRSIRTLRARHPQFTADEVVELAKQISPDGCDYDAGRALDEFVEADTNGLSPEDHYRVCIETLLARNPNWARIIVLGRRKFTQKLSRDEVKCFEFAGLLDDPPSDFALEWWLKISAEFRALDEIETMKRARDAERRSLEHERARLLQLGIDRVPVWVAVDDNTVGYDILSFDSGHTDPVNRLIEVKSSLASPVRFFITRKEWDTALKFGSRYFFHVWDMNTGRLSELNVADVAPRIPSDNSPGRWENATIPLG